jgi:hypothetical protein
LDWLYAPNRFAESGRSAASLISAMSQSPQLSSQQEFKSVVEAIELHAKQSQTLLHEALQKADTWDPERRRCRFKFVDSMINELDYFRMARFVKPRFSQISRNADEVTRMTVKLIEIVKKTIIPNPSNVWGW